MSALWCYRGDHGRWAEQITELAIRRGMRAYLFDASTNLDAVEPGDYAFMRIPQWEPELQAGKDMAWEMKKRGATLIPDISVIGSYEDKLIQANIYSRDMPPTYAINASIGWPRVSQYIAELGLPFISKSRQASASVNVRMVRTVAEARAEYEAVMGPGLPIKVGKGRTGLQMGYLLWQKFCRGNPCDYRVCIVGSHLMMLQRHNAHGTAFASGSGRNNPVNEPTMHEMGALAAAHRFFNRHQMKWCGIDLVWDDDYGKWVVLETTLGWSQKAYEQCVFFDRNLDRSTYHGGEIFDLLLDEIQAGVFE